MGNLDEIEKIILRYYNNILASIGADVIDDPKYIESEDFYKKSAQAEILKKLLDDTGKIKKG